MRSNPIALALTDKSSDDTRTFYQDRIARYLLIYGGIGFAFLVMRTATSISGLSSFELVQPAYWAHAAGVALGLGGWLLTRSGRRSVRVLETIESVAIIGSMVSYVVMGYFIPYVVSPEFTSFLALSMGLLARAIYVPSTARRSLGLALGAAVPHLVISYYAYLDRPDVFWRLVEQEMQSGSSGAASHALMGTLNLGLWWVGTVVITTGASNVIYGLRKEVRDVKRLGQYQLDEKLGEGGMGEVYRASHAMLQRPTAVKLLPADKVGEASITRFEREVQMTAKLTHPNTVTIFDYGHTLDGVFYYAMELLDGATLATVVETDGKLPAERVAHILAHAAGALTEAHDIGLIHRDIKPANIMLCKQGGVHDTVKVVDFGLVKELEKDETASLTQANVVTGTPQYMPPEALTHPETVDARSDLYSLGAVGWYLLTGKDVFEGNTLVEICGHHMHTEPRRPSEEAADVPRDLEDLIMQCLAKNPEDRPQSATELEDGVRRCAAFGDWTRELARQWWERTEPR